MRTVIRWILLFCPATMLYAQAPTQQPKFALEISEDGPPLHYELVPQGELVRGQSLSIAPSPYLHLRSGRATADAKKKLASAFKLAYHVDGDAVAIAASVVFGAFDNNSGSDPMTADHPKQDIGTYSLHPNESVVLQDMEQFGLQPWTIKIVNAQLPTSISLPTINEVPSIQSKILGQDRQGYTMALHNLSSRAVSAFVVETTLDHNSTSSEFNYRGSLIAPNEIHEFRLFCDTSASAVDQSPCAFILTAALFADGSFEGDATAAATLAVPQITNELQRRRLHALMDNILDDPSQDDAAKLARIRSELSKLYEKPDPAILEQIQLRFPGLPRTALDSVSSQITASLSGEKQATLRNLESFANRPPDALPRLSLAQWWTNWQEYN
jgi:hypothetical protein